MIYKLIYWLFKKQLLKIYYLEQSKKKGFENMQNAFVDSEGRKYYKASNDFEIPILRNKAIHYCVLALIRGLSDEEIDKILDNMEGALGEGRKPKIPEIGHLIIEMRRRKKLYLHPDIMFDMVAYLYIREDEDPAKIDKEIHKQKIAQFRKDSIEGLYDFFYEAGLSLYIPYLTKLESEWDEYWDQSTAKVKALNQFLELSSTEQS